jgi:hypothetical protein
MKPAMPQMSAGRPFNELKLPTIAGDGSALSPPPPDPDPL